MKNKADIGQDSGQQLWCPQDNQVPLLYTQNNKTVSDCRAAGSNAAAENWWLSKSDRKKWLLTTDWHEPRTETGICALYHSPRGVVQANAKKLTMLLM